VQFSVKKTAQVIKLQDAPEIMLQQDNRDDDAYTHTYSDDGSYSTITTFTTFASRKTARTNEFDSSRNLAEIFIDGVNDIDSTFFACGGNEVNATSTINSQKLCKDKDSRRVDNDIGGKSEDSFFNVGCLGIGCGLTCGDEDDVRDDVERGVSKDKKVVEPTNKIHAVEKRFRIGKKSKEITSRRDVSFASSTTTPPLYESKKEVDKIKTKQRAPRLRRAFASMIKSKSRASKVSNVQPRRNKYNAEAQAAAAMKGRAAAEDSNKGRELPKSKYGHAHDARARRATKLAPFHRTQALVQETANRLAENHADLAATAARRLAEEQVKAAQLVSEGVESVIRTTAALAEAAEYEVARVAARALADVASTIGRPILQTLASIETENYVGEVEPDESPPKSTPTAENVGMIPASDQFHATLATDMLLSGYRLEDDYIYRQMVAEMLDLATRLENANVEQRASSPAGNGSIADAEMEVLVDLEEMEGGDSNIELVVCFANKSMVNGVNKEVTSLDSSSFATDLCTDESTVASSSVSSVSSASSSTSLMTERRSNKDLDGTSLQLACNEALIIKELGGVEFSDGSRQDCESKHGSESNIEYSESDIQFRGSYHSF